MTSAGGDPASARAWDDAGLVPDRLPSGWRRHARRAHLELLDRWGPPIGRWLKTDLQEERAPGPRALAGALPGLWTGIDTAHSVVAGASRSGVSGAVADVRRLPFGNGTFDGVLSTSTLDHFAHVDEIGVALRELRRVLRDGGRLVLTLDNPQHPLIRLRNALPRRAQSASGMVPYHVGPTLSEDAGRQALVAAGFEVVASTFLLHAPHIVGTRAARWRWVEERALPWLDRLEGTAAAARTGHFVAFHAVAGR
jgi:SAM-dependent methyltransferase